METVRILHVVVGMNRGGYETLLMNLYRQIDRNVIQFDFVTSLPGVYDKEIEALGGRLYRIPFITKVGPFVYARKLRAVLRSRPQDKIVHAHMDKFCGMVMREAKRAGVPVRIAHAHSTQNEGGLLYQIVKNYYGKRIVPYASDLFSCSSEAAAWMYGKAASKAQILPNAIALFVQDDEVRACMRSALGCEDKFVLGHVGRFTEPKNHQFLLNVLEEVKKQRSNVCLLLVGEGALQNEVKQKAVMLKLEENVRFLGARDDVPRVLQAMDCFVFPSLHEGLGMSLIEAQAAGLFCVCSEGVPPEAVVSKHVCRLPLEKGAAYWAGEILAPTQFAPQKMALSDYDAKQVAERLCAFYLKKVEGLSNA